MQLVQSINIKKSNSLFGKCPKSEAPQGHSIGQILKRYFDAWIAKMTLLKNKLKM